MKYGIEKEVSTLVELETVTGQVFQDLQTVNKFVSPKKFSTKSLLNHIWQGKHVVIKNNENDYRVYIYRLSNKFEVVTDCDGNRELEIMEWWQIKNLVKKLVREEIKKEDNKFTRFLILHKLGLAD